MIIRIDNSQASTRLDLWGATSGVFTGIDRSGRGHQGLLIDEETQLIYSRFRYLHAVLGRFTQKDDKYRDSYNLYEYARSSPNDQVDPSGHDTAQPTTCPATNPNTKDQCGPEVTALLYKIAADIDKQFQALSFWGKNAIGRTTTLPWSAQGAWDIDEFFTKSASNSKCGSGSANCAGSVTVSGKCYHQYAVTYWIAGVILRELRSSFATFNAETFVGQEVYLNAAYKKAKDGDNYQEKIDWFWAGTRLNASGVPQDPNLSKCDKCPDPPSKGLTWKWVDLTGTLT